MSYGRLLKKVFQDSSLTIPIKILSPSLDLFNNNVLDKFLKIINNFELSTL